MFCRETGEKPSKKRYERWRRGARGRGYAAVRDVHREHLAGIVVAGDARARLSAGARSCGSTDGEVGVGALRTRRCSSMSASAPRTSGVHPGPTNTHGGSETSSPAASAPCAISASRPTATASEGGRRCWSPPGSQLPDQDGARARRVDWASGQPLHTLREAAAELDVQRLRCVQYEAWRARRIAGDPQAAKHDPDEARRSAGTTVAGISPSRPRDSSVTRRRGTSRAAPDCDFTDEELGRRCCPLRRRGHGSTDPTRVRGLAQGGHGPGAGHALAVGGHPRSMGRQLAVDWRTSRRAPWRQHHRPHNDRASVRGRACHRAARAGP